mmetsp:Transcript_37067/g.86866  ORF Transcript_37067/g.86866 Transcript_37067/m.86866 type:complete len:233 (+) Transcript_37067:314-1012(+)
MRRRAPSSRRLLWRQEDGEGKRGQQRAPPIGGLSAMALRIALSSSPSRSPIAASSAVPCPFWQMRSASREHSCESKTSHANLVPDPVSGTVTGTPASSHLDMTCWRRSSASWTRRWSACLPTGVWALRVTGCASRSSLARMALSSSSCPMRPRSRSSALPQSCEHTSICSPPPPGDLSIPWRSLGGGTASAATRAAGASLCLAETPRSSSLRGDRVASREPCRGSPSILPGT